MDSVHVMALSRVFAKELLKHRDAINGMLLLKGLPVMSDHELCEAGRGALLLIERGEVQ